MNTLLSGDDKVYSLDDEMMRMQAIVDEQYQELAITRKKYHDVEVKYEMIIKNKDREIESVKQSFAELDSAALNTIEAGEATIKKLEIQIEDLQKELKIKSSELDSSFSNNQILEVEKADVLAQFSAAQEAISILETVMAEQQQQVTHSTSNLSTPMKSPFRPRTDSATSDRGSVVANDEAKGRISELEEERSEVS